ncbi:hypothetical protein ASD98_02635 [Flavobacterium sp. Root186]|nr:hypothetical protein ASD98_02635 [Flavobacterium sp. Root186]
MVSTKSMNKFALIICFLFYLTCYLRFAGQAFLLIVQLISAIFLSIEIFSKPNNYKIKNQIKTYWTVTILNAIILFSFFNFIMWNDFLQVVFVTLIPNITAIYFYRILIKCENLGFVI